jgi:hypothetical protein
MAAFACLLQPRRHPAPAIHAETLTARNNRKSFMKATSTI